MKAEAMKNRRKAFKLPESDVIYTFIFPDGKRYKVRYYGTIEGEKNNGKLIFLNVKTKTFLSPMTLSRFNYILKKQLVCLQKINKAPEPAAPTGDELTLVTFIKDLYRMTASTKKSFEQIIGKTLKELADELKGLKAEGSREAFLELYNSAVSAYVLAS